MSEHALVRPDLSATWRTRRGVAIALGLGVVALGLLFNAEVAAAIRTWMDSTAYNHCFLVVPIAAYLAWDRRDQLRGLAAVPLPVVALAGIPIALVWLLAERLGIMEGRQLMAISFVELLALAVLGWRLWWVLCGPLLYLYFLVPFGAFLTPKLQDFTTIFVRHGLDLLHIPAFIDGYTIEIPEGTFYIAEACAGLRFLIASIAFGCLYALLMYRSPWRRVAFIVASIVVPIIANGLRAVGIVSLGHLLGSAQAAATDHVLYGWIFFSLVILLLIGLGLPFREDLDRSAASTTPRPRLPPADNAGWRAAALTAGIIVVIAAVSPVLAMQLDRVRPPAAASLPVVDFGPDCTDLPVDTPALLDVPGTLVARRVACGGLVLDVRLDIFAARSTAAPVLAAARRLAVVPNPTNEEEVAAETGWLPMPAGAQRTWRLTRTTAPGWMVAVGIWVDGQPATGGMLTRARLAWTSLTGARVAPVVVSITPELEHTKVTAESEPAIERRLALLLARADIGGQIGRIAAVRD
jgi:exosortase A